MMTMIFAMHAMRFRFSFLLSAALNLSRNRVSTCDFNEAKPAFLRWLIIFLRPTTKTTVYVLWHIFQPRETLLRIASQISAAISSLDTFSFTKIAVNPLDKSECTMKNVRKNEEESQDVTERKRQQRRRVHLWLMR